MVDESNIVDASEPANAPAIAAIDHNEEDGAMSGLREIKYDKDYVRNRKRTQTKTKASTLLFERASQKESAEGELVLQSLVAKLEERLGLVITSPKLKSLVPSFPLDVDHCSVFGPRSHISRLIQNEVEALNATNEDAGKARALLLQLWDKRVAAAVEDCRRRKISFEALNLIAQTNDKENDSHLLDKYDELKTENLHEAVTYLLHSNKMLAASIEAIELLLEHKFYWDAAVLARRYLIPSNETFKKVFTQWAKVLVHKAMSNFGDAQNTHHGFMIDAAKCYIVMDMYAKAAKHLAKSNDLKSLLLACRLSRIDVKTAELKGDSDAIEAAKRSASEVGDAAIRRCVVMCEWDLAAALIELMQLGQGWSHVISMHQVLLLRLRPVLCQIRLHQNEQFMQRIPADAFPSWAVDIVNSGAFITGIWAYWKDTFSVPSYDTSVADALIVNDVNGNSRDIQRHFILFDAARQMVAGLIQAASDQKDIAHKTFITLLESCHSFVPLETELEKIFKEMAAETSDDKALESIIAVLAAVAIERENATVAAAVVGAEVKEENETAVVQEEAGTDEKDASVKEETTDTAADDIITIDDSINDSNDNSNDNAIDTIEKVDLPTIADDGDHVNSLGEEYSSKQSDVIEHVDGEVIGELDDTQSTEENTDLSLTSTTAVDREEPSCTSLSDLQQVDSTPSTDAIISTDQPDSETVEDTGTESGDHSDTKEINEIDELKNEIASQSEETP